MTTRSMAYDHSTYTTRGHIPLYNPAAGASAVTLKYCAFTALNIFAIASNLITAGTSTATLWNGTATVTEIDGQTYSVIRITNTAAPGATPVLATSTYGPFALSLYNGTQTATQTNIAGVGNYVELFGPGTSGQLQIGTNTGVGGFTVNQDDILYVVQGTDATAVGSYTLEYNVTPLASVSN